MVSYHFSDCIELGFQRLTAFQLQYDLVCGYHVSGSSVTDPNTGILHVYLKNCGYITFEMFRSPLEVCIINGECKT